MTYIEAPEWYKPDENPMGFQRPALRVQATLDRTIGNALMALAQYPWRGNS